MAENKEKASRVLQKMFDISENEYDLMRHNAKRYERTDAAVEDEILRQIYSRDDVRDVMEGNTGNILRQDSVFALRPAEFGKTKTFNAAGVLEAIGAAVPEKGDGDTAEEKLVKLWDDSQANRNFIRNRVAMKPEYGATAADNLDQLIETARIEKTKPEVSWPAKVAGALLAPRVLEAAAEGRDWTGKDLALDLGEDALMAIPIGGAAVAGAKLAGRAKRIKRMEDAAKKALDAHKNAALASKILGGAAGSAVVPFAMEGLDAAVYDPDENLDRSTFQLPDAIGGAATNVSAPFMLSRLTGRLGRWLYGGNPLAKIEGKSSPLGAALGSFITNRYGTNRNAQMTLGAIGGFTQFIDPELDLSEKLNDWRDENAREARDEARSRAAGNVLAGGLGLAATGGAGDPDIANDAFWLSKIADDPSIARGKGLGESTEFKNWWNTRGMRILNNTGLFGGTKK